MSNVLVTGSTGYIGRCVVSALNEQGHCVYAASRSVIQSKYEKFDCRLDLSSKLVVPFDVLPKIDILIHCAGVSTGISDANGFYVINGLATIELAKLAEKAGVPVFVVFSSLAVYGETFRRGGAVNEKTSEIPCSDYGWSKLLADTYLRSSSIPSVYLVRPPMVLGEGAKGTYRAITKIAAISPFVPKFPSEEKKSVVSIDSLTLTLTNLLKDSVTGRGVKVVIPREPIAKTLSEVYCDYRATIGKKTYFIPVPHFVETIIKRILGHKLDQLFCRTEID